MPKISLAEKPDFKGDFCLFPAQKAIVIWAHFLVVFFIGRGDNVSCAL